MNKKKLTILITLIFLSVSCASKSQKTSRPSLPLKGKTSTSTETPKKVDQTPESENQKDSSFLLAEIPQSEQQPEPTQTPLPEPAQLPSSEGTPTPQPEAIQTPQPETTPILRPGGIQPPQPVETPTPQPEITQFPLSEDIQPPQPVETPTPQPEEDKEIKKERLAITNHEVAFNFDNVDIKDFIDTISEITNQNFIIAPGVSGRVSIITTGRIPREEVFGILESVLEVNNLTVVKSGQFYKVIPIAIARQKPIDIEMEKKDVTGEDRVVTHIVRLKYISPTDAINVLGPFVSQTSGNLHPYPRSNILIITDLASNVRRLISILEEIDVNLYERLQIEIFYIQHVPLEDLVKELEQILTAIPDGSAGAGQGGLITKFVPITRYNALMLITSSAKVTQLVREWFKILDQPAKETTRRNYIYYVKHSKADDLAKVLEQLYRGKPGERVTITQTPTATRRQEERPSPRPPVQLPGTRLPQPGQPAQPAQPSVPDSTGIQTTSVGEADVLIVADELTNALIIRTSPAEYQAIKELLDELDLRPAQVLIETLIVEVTLDKSTIFGIQGTLLGQDQITLGGETNSFQSQAQTQFPDQIGATTGFTYILQAAGRFAAQLRTLATENRVKVLSNPHILVRNNEKATIQVGEEIPILTGVSTVPTTGTDGTTTNQFINSVQYRDTGIILRVTPRINKEGAVVLDVEQEVSNVLSTSFGDTRSPSFGKRNSSTSVVAQNGQTLIIGGLIRENQNRNEQGVPGVSRVPLLGRLFRGETNSVNKTELLILVTPQVIETPREGDKATQEFSQKIQALQKFFVKSDESDIDKILKFLKVKKETSLAPVQ